MAGWSQGQIFPILAAHGRKPCGAFQETGLLQIWQVELSRVMIWGLKQNVHIVFFCHIPVGFGHGG